MPKGVFNRARKRRSGLGRPQPAFRNSLLTIPKHCWPVLSEHAYGIEGINHSIFLLKSTMVKYNRYFYIHMKENPSAEQFFLQFL